MKHNSTDYEIEAWLGDVELDEDQMIAFSEVWDQADILYSDEFMDEKNAYLSSALQQILGESTLEEAGTDWQKAQADYHTARAALYGALRVAHMQGESVRQIGIKTGVAQNTIDKAVGRITVADVTGGVYEWEKVSDWELRTEWGRYTIEIVLEPLDNRLNPAIYVSENGKYIADSRTTRDWPIVERFLPRKKWPDEIYSGTKGPATREIDATVEDFLQKAQALEEEELEEELEYTIE